jgi:hypothetical protein
MNSTSYDIDIMSQIIGMLHSLPIDEQNNDYKHIMDLVNNYLLKNCKHHIISDHVDTDIERSETIKYCEKCYLTFD